MKADTIKQIVIAEPKQRECPLCGQANACANLAVKDVTQSCWCNDPDIRFPEALLLRIPVEKRGQACVCRACVSAFVQEKQAKSDS